MFRFAAHQFSSSLLNCSKAQSQKLASSALWSHLAPLSASGNVKSRNPYDGFSQKHNLSRVCVRSTLHTSAVLNDKPDLLDEAQKRYKHMLTQVDWREIKKSPQPALAYGAAGLIPFVFPPLAILLNNSFLPNLAFVQLAYGASILAFLGGVKWGFAVPDNSHQKLTWENLGTSVSFPLVAFASLILPAWLGTVTLMAGLGASAYVDITSAGYPQWFKAMRLCLSGVAIGSLLFGLLLRMLY